MAIPQNLKQFLSDAYQNAGVAGRAGKDPADAFRIKGNTISWDFEVETFETPVEQGIIPDNIRAAGALHYIYTLGEICGIFRVTDAILYMWAAGNLDVPNDADGSSTATQLYRYYKLRDERASAEERALLYKRVLNIGDVALMDRMVANREYPALWNGLMQEMVKYIQKEESLSGNNIRLSRKPVWLRIQDLQYNLSASMAGMALIQTTEIYYQFKECVDILKNPDIVAQLGNGYRRNMWTVIERISTQEFGTLPNVSSLRTIAEEGQNIFKGIAAADQGVLLPGSALFEDLKQSVELFITAKGERAEMERANLNPESGNPMDGINPMFKNMFGNLMPGSPGASPGAMPAMPSMDGFGNMNN